MGRHSAPGRGPFVRSLLAWVLPWVLLAGVIGSAVWIALGELGGEALKSPPAGRPAHRSEPGSTDALARPSPSPALSPNEAPATQAVPSGRAVPNGAGITVQVLNGSSAAGAAERVADELAQLGYTIVAVQGSSAAYEVTTVFWSSEQARAAAQELAAYMGWPAEAKPANLSAAVDLHVVVGADEA